MPPGTGKDHHWYKHGLRKHSAYTSWYNMMKRCRGSYGDLGIEVCERWHDLRNFIADMGERPDGYSIERIDNSGDYEPDNCRWATPKEQVNNQRPRSVRLLECQGEKRSINGWAKYLGLSYQRVYRLLKRGCTIEDIVVHYSV